jgi:transcriptional regulator with XRE-family HTH domain
VVKKMACQNRVKYYREKAGISIEELANAIKKTPDYVRKIEKGQRGLTMDTGIDISNFLGKSLNTIFMP